MQSNNLASLNFTYSQFIEAGFLSRLFTSQSKVIKKLSKWKEDWLEKSLNRKPAPIEVILYTGSFFDLFSQFFSTKSLKISTLSPCVEKRSLNEVTELC